MEQQKHDTTKDELIFLIKEWIQLDNQISKLNLELKEKKANKKHIADMLIDKMKQKQLETININGGGSIVYKKTITKKPINQKTLLTSLTTYFKDNNINVEELSNFILENREENIKENILRKIK